ncbi:MAG: ketoacyl-ACP synthase III [Nitrospirae bacterium]|nr:ketoacyl-ACP synthase III [Nitrospirota bacterium]
MKTRIIGTGSYLPKRIMTNRDLERLVETTESWILERTGIRERRIADEREAASDLAVHAARQSLEMSGIDEKDLDLIIVATATPDMFFPSTACIVQDRIGARQAAAFDLSAACSGFLFALSVADQYIRNGVYRQVLIIGSEVMSRIIDWTDRNTCVLFGDGAGAAVLQRTQGEHGVLSSHLHSDGRLWSLIQVPGGGSRIPPSPAMLAERKPYIKMKGNETFKVAVRTLEEAVHETLKAAHVQPSELSLLIPHQANIRIILAVAQRLGLPMEKVMLNVERYGNTSAASIPIALDEAVRGGRVNEGDLLLFEAFGAGLTWGSALVRW